MTHYLPFDFVQQNKASLLGILQNGAHFTHHVVTPWKIQRQLENFISFLVDSWKFFSINLPCLDLQMPKKKYFFPYFIHYHVILIPQ